MNYIINPWWFYLAGVLNALRGVALCGVVLGALLCLILLAFYCSHDCDYGYDEAYAKRIIRIAKKIGIALGVCVTLIIIAPSETTTTKMMIANTLTTENIKGGADFTQDQIGQIIDKIADAAIKVKQTENGDKS